MGLPKPEAFSLAKRREINDPTWRQDIRAALESAGNVVDAAATLGIQARTLWKYIGQDASLKEGIPLRGPGKPRKT